MYLYIGILKDEKTGKELMITMERRIAEIGLQSSWFINIFLNLFYFIFCHVADLLLIAEISIFLFNHIMILDFKMSGEKKIKDQGLRNLIFTF